MRKIFKSGELACDAEVLGGNDTYIIRFYDHQAKRWPVPLSDLVIVPSDYGFLRLRRVGGDAVLSGILDARYFSKAMTEDILAFLEDILPDFRNMYLPYHIDFASLSDYDEYNGEY